MATTIKIQSGNTLGGLASKHGTTVQELMKLNPSITDPNKIFAGRDLVLPGETGTPGADLKGTLSTTPPEKTIPTTTPTPSKLGNFTTTLRAALNEAAVRRAQSRFQQLAPELQGAAPGSMAGVTALIRNGIETPVESTFKDMIEARKQDLELGELDVESVGGFEILRNPRTGEVVSTRVVSDDDSSISEKRYALEANVSQYLNGSVFTDGAEKGYVPSEAYIEAKNRWVKGGGTLDSFRSNFPPELYLSETSQQYVPAPLRTEELDNSGIAGG